ncbi:hypothetical protein [Undibacterium crateris]|uniref:hypothetical protein n=1 Tax=Undibacterium crateris TaxID=2528175 RepID=UPI00138947BE|nr:hypothetical protein [Undibacterium crateris]NDI87663.1 hypothetical protein [Undibacterium crateris]
MNIKMVIKTIRQVFFWTELDTLERELAASNEALFHAQKDSEMAITTLKMLNERLTRLRGSINNSKVLRGIEQSEIEIEMLQELLETSSRDMEMLRMRIPRLEKNIFDLKNQSTNSASPTTTVLPNK